VSHRFVVADVFTDRPLTGNQLAVFPDAGAISEDLLQPLAREINFSETVFAYPAAAGGDVRIRIFTPTAELPFAGHPVLGSAFVLAGERDEIALETGKGIVPVTLTRDGDRITSGRMVQPIPSWAPFGAVDELLAGLGIEVSGLPVEIYDVGARHVMVALPSADAVDALRPDLTALANLDTVGIDCFAGDSRSWWCRVFAPAGGVPEDPATGSAAGPLAVHLARHGRTSFGDEIEITQGVAMGRPSRLLARADGAGDIVERVEVAGAAVIVGDGTFSL
jgi:trans-2,3-dihydro-3-hydroxyanthranilate isomerase